MNTAAPGGVRPPFTISQWQELEHQALIFKYLMAGVPVPPELLLPIRRSFEAMASRFYQSHPTMGYCSFYGKKLDPEPGRCRRTDGKKWRCSKEAYPGSKYCERHMHRGRNRSRKPVETHTLSQTPHSSSSPSPSPASSVTSLTLTDSNVGYGSSRNTVVSNCDITPLHSIADAHNQGSSSGANSHLLHLDSVSYSGIGPKDYRHLQGFRTGVDEPGYFPVASRNDKELGLDSSLDTTWNLMPSGPSYSLSKYGNGLDLTSNYTQLHSLHDLKQESVATLTGQQHYYEGQFGSSSPNKEESQSIRPFLDQWPRTRDSWYDDFDKERSNHSSYSTTHLSISIPMASSDFSTSSSRSANDE